MSKTLKMYLGVIIVVAVLGAFSYMAQRTNSPMPTPGTGDSCAANPGGASGTTTESDSAPARKDITLDSLDGKRVSLSDFKGQVVILDFWATWCAPCRELIPIMNRIEREYASKGVKVIGINQGESRSVVQRFARDSGYNALVLLDEDGSAGAEYSVAFLPTVVIIDREGKVRRTIQGLLPDMKDSIEQEIEPLL